MSFFAPLIRIGAFARKEMIEIFRQPRLLLTLILGPFLILLLFGIGYRNEGRSLRALVVVGRENPVHQTVREYAQNLGSQLQVVGISENLAEAKSKLRHREVDLVVLVPDQSLQALRSSQQMEITVLHNEVDPYQADYVEFTGQLYTDKLNRWILGNTLEKKKSQAGVIQKDLAEAIQAVQVLKNALDSREITVAQANQKKVNEILARIEGRMEGEIAKEGALEPSEAEEIRSRRQALHANVDSLTNLNPEQTDYLKEARVAAEIEKDRASEIVRFSENRSTSSGLTLHQ